jgi:hypothetical protein
MQIATRRNQTNRHGISLPEAKNVEACCCRLSNLEVEGNPRNKTRWAEHHGLKIKQFEIAER